jgi:hypothetical protein
MAKITLKRTRKPSPQTTSGGTTLTTTEGHPIPPRRDNRLRTIEITVNEDGEFSYSHAVLTVKAGDAEVQWISRQGPFTLDFGGGSPFQRVIVRSKPAGKDLHITDPLPVVQGATLRDYKYMVAVCVMSTGQVHLEGSPIIVIDC